MKTNHATRTLRLRLKDKNAAFLREQSRAVNFVWNYVNELSVKHFERKRAFLSAYDMQPYTKGAGKELGLHSQTVQAVQEEYVTRRKQFKKVKLRWRVSGGSRRSLGWVPFKASAIRYKGGQVWYAGRPLSLWDSYGLSVYELGTGSFSEDSRGRWYLNVTAKPKLQHASLAAEGASAEGVKVLKPEASKGGASVGIDLGLKDFLATSDGVKVEAQRFYRDMEDQLASAQRANKKQRVKAIHAKIANRRKDVAAQRLPLNISQSEPKGRRAASRWRATLRRQAGYGCETSIAPVGAAALHKLSTQLVNEYGAIFIGNVNASGLAKTNMAKSVLDAGWSAFRTMLQYKCDDAGVWFEEVDEAYSTQTCSCCGARTGPKGVAGLGIRGWSCSECGSEHDRDINAARNILARGLARLAEGTPPEEGLKAVEVRVPVLQGGE